MKATVKLKILHMNKFQTGFSVENFHLIDSFQQKPGYFVDAEALSDNRCYC